MRILIACEESQTETVAFRARGHEAYSCDIQDCTGGHPEWHIKGDVLPLINGHCTFVTMDGKKHRICRPWDMIIAHPPCTYLTISGNRWYNVERYGADAMGRIMAREAAILFFLEFAFADCPKIAIENPVGVMSKRWRKPDQIIQPWQFATCDEELTEKATCLWLKGMPPLVPTRQTKPHIAYHQWVTPDGVKKRQTMWYYQTRCLPPKERAKAASKSFAGIAEAMASQWGG